MLFFLSTLPWSPQTPFTFGLNQRAPYTAGDRCLLCRCERKDGAVPSEAGMPGQNGMSQPNKTPSALQLPLWVCSDCRRTVEKEDRHTALEQSLGVSHLWICGIELSLAVLQVLVLAHLPKHSEISKNKIGPLFHFIFFLSKFILALDKLLQHYYQRKGCQND